jgi:ribose transport system ATP-binding protein
MNAQDLLTARHLSKTYGSRLVLDDARISVRAGEIHALLGQNGSGKSTLIGILAGRVSPDRSESASMTVAGAREDLPILPERSAELGMAFVPQELGLVGNATVMESLGLGRYCTTAYGRVRWSRQRALTAEVLRRFGLNISPDAPVSSLPEVERAMLAIIRGVESLPPGRPGVLVLDEPTAYLPADAVHKVFEVLRRIARQGSAIVLVTHRLDEVMEVCDRATVLLGGKVVGTFDVQDMTKQALITQILGVEMDQLYPDLAPPSSSEAVLEVTDLRGGLLRGISFQVGRGEILGITGLVGGGFDEVVRRCFGAAHTRGTGTVTFGAAAFSQAKVTPALAMKHGAAFIPSDRRRAGGVMTATALENVTMADLESYSTLGRIRHRRLRETGIASMADVGVTPLDPDLPFSSFSGGNQQKMIFAKWLRREPQILLLHEPTHGVDVGAKRVLFSLIQDAAAQGAAVVIASAEYEDLAHLCHRVLVVHDGRVETELRDKTLTMNHILQACLTKSAVAS